MALNIMDQKGSSYSTDDVKTAVNHLKQMTSLLCEEASGSRKEVDRDRDLGCFFWGGGGWKQ